MKVCVLLSTYNGEKFLEEQLESIAAQEGVEPVILVRDDGSSDLTCRILDRWQDQGRLKWYTGRNLGFALSFMDLVAKAPDCDYYAFCDQDDIWLADKLKRAVDVLEGMEKPVRLYCSNVFYYKDGQNHGGIHKVPQQFDRYTCMLRNIAPGCSMVFSREMRDVMAQNLPQRIIAHDFWVFQIGVLLGQVYYDFESGMLYRQHDNNQIGQKVSRIDKWKRRFRDLCSDSKRHEREFQAAELLRCHQDQMDSETVSIVSAVAEYRRSLGSRIKLISDSRFTMGNRKADLYLALRILCSRL